MPISTSKPRAIDHQHPTLFPTEFENKRAWNVKGAVEWCHLTREQHRTQYTSVNALAETTDTKCCEVVRQQRN